MNIGAVILAAGESKRVGGIKQLLLLGGKPILQHVIDVAEASGFSQIAVVLGAHSEEIQKEIIVGSHSEILTNSHWMEGQSTSVRMGVEQLEEKCDVIFFMLGDQPFVTSELMKNAVEVFSKSDAEIVIPAYNGERGNPVLFAKACFADLKHLEGDRGGKQIFSKHRLREFERSSGFENMDIDTIEDYHKAVNLYNARSHFCAIILSAGLSTRMKQPKLLMQWGRTSVLGAVISSFQQAGVEDIHVVTGGFRERVEEEAEKQRAAVVFNPEFENGSMLDSMKTGIKAILTTNYDAAFIALGDQPAISHEDILQMTQLFMQTRAPLIIPSFEMRRGHPWLVSRDLWPQVLRLEAPKTMRDFIESNKDQITYYIVKSSRILDDLDTPEDYEKFRPR